ncbi:MAG: hypothetical protein JWR18_913 [Segetibacter sp.]|jgi:opacity protein-like surface antigen|nr:hypothetical protein [Segetibacter sp.]
MYKFLSTLFIFISTVSISQPVRVHFTGGFANYNGDLQQKRVTLQQAKGAIGAGVTFNLSDRLSVRSDYTFANVSADDKRNKNSSLAARNLNFNTRLYELTLLGEYDILDLNQHKISPYVFGGVGLFHYDPYTTGAAGEKVYLSYLSTEGQGFLSGKKNYKKTDFNIPLGAGVKYALSDEIRIGFELGLRVLRTDYLDDVSSYYVNQNTLRAARGQTAVDFAFRGDELKNNPAPYPSGGTTRGNNKVNDFYYFGLFRIDFRLNWFDNGGSGPGGRGSVNCPVKL